MANNKIQLADGTVLIDLTEDTVTADKILEGYTTHSASGEKITGTLQSANEIYVGTGDMPEWATMQVDPTGEAFDVGVTSFNGRSGEVLPQSGDYTAEMVGALPNNTNVPSSLSDLAEDEAHRLVTDAEKSAWNNKQNALAAGSDYATPEQVNQKITNPSTKTNGQILTYNGSAWVAADAPSSVTESEKNTWNNKQDALQAGTDYATPTQLNEKITDPTTKASGQVLTYNGSSWVAQTPTSGGNSGGVDESGVLAILNRTTPINAEDTNYGTIMARGIYAGTEDLTEGVTELPAGVIYLKYRVV